MKRLLGFLVCGAVILGACGSDNPGVSESVTVFAASSLTDALPDLAAAFTARHPDAKFQFSFASSSDLAAQVLEGAPVDVFVTADDSNMQKVIDGGEAETDPVTVAKNTFEIIVAKGNPKGITGVADLAQSDLIVVNCVDTAPCGRGAVAILANAGVSVAPKSFEEKVKGVVTKVTSGEADAGIVFVTDVLAASGMADGIEIPVSINVLSSYPMVVTKSSTHLELAKAFIDFVAGSEGRAILAKYGFLAP